MSTKTTLSRSGGSQISSERLYELWVSNSLEISYTAGMQSDRESEAEKNVLPKGQNTPQRCNYNLYAEQLSGTSFTTPRNKNLRNWLYRILPSAKHSIFEPLNNNEITKHLINNFTDNSTIITPNRIRWNPYPLNTLKNRKIKFYEGWKTYCGAGNVEMKQGLAIHLYLTNESMFNESMCNADGDLLIVPQTGSLLIRTENGIMEVEPGYIAIIQRGIHFAVFVKQNINCRGYICEVFESHFVIPDLGPIGANGLANPRDFETVVASYENRSNQNEFNIIQKFCGKLFKAKRYGSMFDVVGWHGNYIPYRYDLKKFCAVNSVTFDHMDPSIFTVLTAPTPLPGVACCDFVIFPPRWSVHTNTFRPPYYHRNCMSEFMGNIYGIYEAKRKGFLPGGGSMHSCMTPHGPDANTFEIASKEKQIPVPPIHSALAFMFESYYSFRFTKLSMDPNLVQSDYDQCWQGLKNNYTKSKL